MKKFARYEPFRLWGNDDWATVNKKKVVVYARSVDEAHKLSSLPVPVPVWRQKDGKWTFRLERKEDAKED